MKKLLIIFLLLIPITSYSKWTKQDTHRELIWQSFHIIDWGQTLDISKNPDKYYEMNPILGKHPSVSDVNLWAVGASTFHFGLSYIMPKEYRKIFQWTTIGFKGYTIYNNHKINLKVNF
jgi:hypothetical protein